MTMDMQVQIQAIVIPYTAKWHAKCNVAPRHTECPWSAYVQFAVQQHNILLGRHALGIAMRH